MLAFVRRYEDETHPGRGQPVALRRSTSSWTCRQFQGMAPVEMFGRTPFPPVGELPYLLTLGPLRLLLVHPGAPGHGRGRGCVRRRRAADPAGQGEMGASPRRERPPGAGEGFTCLPATSTVVHGDARSIERTVVLDAIAIPYASSRTYLTLVRADFMEGDSQTYVLPLTFAGPKQTEQVQKAFPQAVIGRVRVKGVKEEAVVGRAALRAAGR